MRSDLNSAISVDSNLEYVSTDASSRDESRTGNDVRWKADDLLQSSHELGSLGLLKALPV
jgi:hypothetical protein